MLGTRNALLAAFGSFARRSSNVLVVVILSFNGVPRDTLGSCTSAILQYAVRPRRESNAAVFKHAVIVRGLWGVGTARFEFVFHKFYVINYVSLICWVARSFPSGFVTKSMDL